MIRILHTADLHLDSPFASLSVSESAARREKLRGVFSSMTAFARDEKLDLFIIAGDLFDARFVTRDTMDLIRSEFEKIPDTYVFITPGNHDPYESGSVWERLELPENVCVFRSDMIKKVSLPEKNVDVYGFAFTSPAMRKSPLVGQRTADPARINILAAHTQIDDPLSPYAPISRDQLAAFGADYAALGHVHDADRLWGEAGKCKWAYSGCPEGRSFDECGRKYALIATVEKTAGVAEVKVTKKEFSTRRYEKADVDVTGAAGAAEVRDAVKRALSDAGYDENTALRLRLIGQTDRPVAFDGLREALGVGSLEIKDETLAILNAGLDEDRTIRGEFYRAIKPRLESADEREREIAVRALKYALFAMSGEDVPE